MKKLLFTAYLLLLSGCTSYFSNYRTVYRIETTTGERYYSDSEPDLNDEVYIFEDLDGNEYKLSKGRISKVEKFKHKK